MREQARKEKGEEWEKGKSEGEKRREEKGERKKRRRGGERRGERTREEGKGRGEKRKTQQFFFFSMIVKWFYVTKTDLQELLNLSNLDSYGYSYKEYYRSTQELL